MDNELERIWKEMVVAKFKVLSWLTMKPQKTWVRITSLWAEIWTNDFPNTKQEC
jgi:hypothetical protein